jgi:hypothetical protein
MKDKRMFFTWLCILLFNYVTGCSTSCKQFWQTVSRFKEVEYMPPETPLNDVLKFIFEHERYEIFPKGMRLMLSGHNGTNLQILFKRYNPIYTRSEIDSVLFGNVSQHKRLEQTAMMLSKKNAALHALKISDIHSITLYNKHGEEKVLLFVTKNE